MSSVSSPRLAFNFSIICRFVLFLIGFMSPENSNNNHPIFTHYSMHFRERPTLRDRVQSIIDRLLGRIPYGNRGELKFWAEDIFKPKQNP